MMQDAIVRSSYLGRAHHEAQFLGVSGRPRRLFYQRAQTVISADDVASRPVSIACLHVDAAVAHHRRT